MREILLFSVTLVALMIAGGAVAEDVAEAPAPAVEVPAAAAATDDALAWDQFDDPEFDPATVAEPTEAAPTFDDDTVVAATAPEEGNPNAAEVVAEAAAPASIDTVAEAAAPASIDTVAEAAAPASIDTVAEIATPDSTEADVSGVTLQPETAAPTTVAGVVLGPVGVDDRGRTGRLHTVARGDTLWDLSAAYLGTPWVWPSVWIDNDDIANPHLIVPGDRIWITANEMRVVTDAEAESFLEAPVVEETVASVDETAPTDAPVFEELPPISVEEEPAPLAAMEPVLEDDPSTLDAFPVAIPGEEPSAQPAGRAITIARRDSYGFVSTDAVQGASTIVESPSPRTFLSAGDEVFVGIGEGDAEVGDQYMIFEILGDVRDIETNRLLGHHVENLGWLEVKELTGDTSIAEIRQSYSEFRRGARIMVREQLPRRVSLRSTPDAIDGQVVYLPSDRTLAADGEYVYLNRGEFHGLEVGSELEVFASGRIFNERERRVDVRTPDTPVATLVVVTVDAESSVAFVLYADREIAVGDSVRPVVDRTLAQN